MEFSAALDAANRGFSLARRVKGLTQQQTDGFYPKSGYRDFPRSQAPVVDYFFLGDGIFYIGVK